MFTLSPTLAPFYFIKSNDKPSSWSGLSQLPSLGDLPRSVSLPIWLPALWGRREQPWGTSSCGRVLELQRLPLLCWSMVPAPCSTADIGWVILH